MMEPRQHLPDTIKKTLTLHYKKQPNINYYRKEIRWKYLKSCLSYFLKETSSTARDLEQPPGQSSGNSSSQY